MNARTALAAAIEAAAAGADVAMSHFEQHDLHRWIKPDGSLVTAADVAAESAVRAVLDRLAPDDHVLGEEHGGTTPRGRRWIVDPIDGTENFSRGNPVWATLVARETNGQVDVAVIDAPALDRRWWAARGSGAFAGRPRGMPPREGRSLRVSEKASRGEATFGYGGLHECPTEQVAQRLITTARQFRCAWGWGNFWGHVLVAEGVVDAALSFGESIWDIAAPALLVTEAGGRWSDVDGLVSLEAESFLTTNGLLHDSLVDDLAGASTAGHP